MNRIAFFLLLLTAGTLFSCKSQEETEAISGLRKRQITKVVEQRNPRKLKNVILFVSDGMGHAQLEAARVANYGELSITKSMLQRASVNTQAVDGEVTDGAAAGTALATGVRTNVGYLGLDKNGNSMPSILVPSYRARMKIGMISSSRLTDPTPAAFYAKERDAGDRKLLVKALERVPLHVSLEAVSFAPSFNKTEITPLANAITSLARENKGFLLVVHGGKSALSKSETQLEGLIDDLRTFDYGVSQALAFAARNGETLVVVTGSYESGGMVITEKEEVTGSVKAKFTSDGNTAMSVPLFAFGPGASKFHGQLALSDISEIISALLQLD